MIEWSIDAAREAGIFSRIIVSTDDAEIAQVARNAGADVPFMRTSELADDHTPTVPVIADAVTRLGLEGTTPVCCLYATAPFVRPQDLLAGQTLLLETMPDFVATTTTFAFPIQRALGKDDGEFLSMLDPAQSQRRSQDLQETWHDAGQFYWGYAATWIRPDSRIFEARTLGLCLPRHRVQDIDTTEDWARAELLMQVMQRTHAD